MEIGKSRGGLPESINIFAVLAEGARFEASTTPETIDLDLLLSFRFQSLIEESEAGEESIKTDGIR